ncbi:helix-turn-helix domain-containing protein [Actinosynnema sp. NPDC004786]
MSWQAVQWALDRAPMLRTGAGKLDATARFVLVALAERADGGSRAFPSLAALRYVTGLDMKTVQRALSRLAVGGLITAVGKRGDGVTEWVLHTDRIRPASDREEIDAEVQAHRERDRTRKRKPSGSGALRPEPGADSGALRPEVRGVASGSGETSGALNPDSGALSPEFRDAEPARTDQGTDQEPTNARTRARAGDDATTGLLPGLLVSVPDPAKPAPDFEAEFAQWWNVWPEKRGRRADAYRAYVKARRGQRARTGDPARTPVSAELLLDAARRFAAEMRRTRRPVDKIPHGSTWLNGDGWESYQDIPRPRVVNGPTFEGW